MTKTYSIVGMNFTKSEDIVRAMQPGAELVLLREPTNPHDKNAVAVYHDGRKLGYIPKKTNGVLAMFIDRVGAEVPTPTELPPVEAAPGAIAADTALEITRAFPGKFVRSPNSGYPMVEVSE